MFDEVRISADIEKDAVGGPGFKTVIAEQASGHEKRNISWSLARGQWDIGYAWRDAASIRAIVTFFYARFGRGRGFRFKDWLDFTATDEDIGTGDGVTTTFQLRKQYISGSSIYNRLIYKPVAGTLTIELDSVPTVAFVIDNTTGIVTFDTAPLNAVAITASFEFDVPVRFNIDQLLVTSKTLDVEGIPTIPIIELRQ